jgi:hypothetical protein
VRTAVDNDRRMHNAHSSSAKTLTEGGTAIAGNRMQELFKQKLECIIKDKTRMNNKENNIWDIFSYTKNEQRIFRITKVQFWFGSDYNENNQIPG